MNAPLARLKAATTSLIPVLWLGIASSAQAQVQAPDVVTTVDVKPNPTATVTPVCHTLGEGDYSQAFHASCYSEINQAVVVLVSGNTQDFSGQAIASFVVDEFEKAYVPAVGYLRLPELDGVAMTFLLNGDAYGPYSGENWREGFEVLKTHAPQAWFKR